MTFIKASPLPLEMASFAGKQKNIAVVAVARELAGFIRDISQLAMALAAPREGLAA